MTYDEYAKFVQKKFVFTGHENAIFHAFAGLVKETGELLTAVQNPDSKKNKMLVLDELGDILFYLFALRQEIAEGVLYIGEKKEFVLFSYDFASNVYGSVQAQSFFNLLPDLAQEIAPYIWSVYNKNQLSKQQLQSNIWGQTVILFDALFRCIACFATLQEVVASNVVKLNHRHGEGAAVDAPLQNR